MQVFIVTGAASGLGKAASIAIVEAGYAVMMTDLNCAAEALAQRLGPKAAFAKASVTVPEQVQSVVDAAIAKFGRLDGVINCAGVGAAMKTTSAGKAHDAGVFEFVLKVNLLGTFYMSSMVATAIAKQKISGRHGGTPVIINVASVAAFEGQKGQVAYAASKGAVRAMTLPMARDLAKYGIRVVAIAPGIFDTPMMDVAPDSVRQSLVADVVSPKRFGKPEEFAKLVCHIIANDYINATTIRLDGGIRMSNL